MRPIWFSRVRQPTARGRIFYGDEHERVHRAARACGRLAPAVGRLGKAVAQLANGASRRWRIRHHLERVHGFDDRMMADLVWRAAISIVWCAADAALTRSAVD